jgi:hypothetical protein
MEWVADIEGNVCATRGHGKDADRNIGSPRYFLCIAALRA